MYSASDRVLAVVKPIVWKYKEACQSKFFFLDAHQELPGS